MAKKTILKERGTNQELYPVTTLDCISDFPQGKTGQLLAWEGNKPQWKGYEEYLLDNVAYGVEWKPNVADPALLRVGNMTYHKTLPIQSGMKGCIYNPKLKRVVYWLEDFDWNLRKGDKMYYPIGDPINIEIQHYDDETEKQYQELLPHKIRYKYRFVAKVESGIAITDFGVLNSSNYELEGELFFCPYKGYLLCPQVDGTYVYANAVMDFPIDSSDEIYHLSRLDGKDGEVMVYIPEFWIKSWDEPDRRRVMISPIEVDTTWEHQPAIYLSAYRDTVLNTVPSNMGYLSTLKVNSAVSIANDQPYCRGGNNDTANDKVEDIFRRQLGKCRTYISRTRFRDYARQSGKEILSYRQYKNIMYWLWVIEYATFNSQATYNSELTSEGFRQGGMGPGLTTMANWGPYNSLYPITPNGYTNELGNGTGVMDIVIPAFTYGEGSTQVSQTLKATRWRGLENPFGDIWINVDGIIIDADANNHPDSMNYVYTTDDPSKYGDTRAVMADMVLSGLETHTDGYIKEWDLGTTAEIIPRLNGGNPSQYRCDYHLTGNKDTNLRILLLGGSTGSGSYAGFGYFHSSFDVTYSGTNVGFRTSCIAS